MSRDPSVILAVGVLFSIILGGVAYFLERRRTSNADPALGATLALLGIVLSGLIAHDFQEQARFEAAVPQIQSSSLRLLAGDIASLDRDLRESTKLLGVRELILEPVRQVLSSSIENARGGRVVLESKAQAMRMAATIMDSANRNIWVTSYIDPDIWWQTSAGEKYEDMTSKSSNLVDFERIFIVDNEEEFQRPLPVMKRQAEMGVKVRSVMGKELDVGLQRDILVIDDIVAAEIVLSQGRQFGEAVFFFSQALVEDFAEKFRQIRVLAKDLEMNQEPP